MVVRLTKAAIAVAGLFALASPAPAREVRSGYWTVFDTKGGGENKPLCGMKTSYADVGASIIIKYVLRERTLLVHVFKPGWLLPEKPIQLPITLGFDRGVFGSTTAMGYTKPGLTPVIEFNIANEATESFLTEFGKANWMWIRFDEGTEKPWPAKMEGSRDAATYFASCIKSLIDANSTQPYGKPSTQPYGGSQTQPYGNDAPPQLGQQPIPLTPKQPAKDSGAI